MDPTDERGERANTRANHPVLLILVPEEKSPLKGPKRDQFFAKKGTKRDQKFPKIFLKRDYR